jgi:flagellin
MISVNTNIQSLNAQMNLNNTQNSLNKTMQRLSSGLRINSAADDAAGLAISQGMKSSIAGMNQATNNTNDGMSYAQTADGALSTVSNILTTMVTLATQAATGTVGQSQRSYINSEFGKLAQEITRIASATQFNGIHMLGTSTTTTIQVGTGALSYDTIGISTKTMNSTALNLTGGIDTSGTAQAMLTTINKAISSVNASRANLGTVQNRFAAVVTNLQNAIVNTTAAESQIADVNIATETANLTRSQILKAKAQTENLRTSCDEL